MSAKQSDTLTDAETTVLAQQALACYPAPLQGELKLLCRSENATFLLLAGGKRYALRLHRPDYHSKADIQSELLWLDALREIGIMVPQAIPASDGETVLTIGMPDGGVRHAVLFHWIEGEMPTTEVDPKASSSSGTSLRACISTVAAGKNRLASSVSFGIITPWSAITATGAAGRMRPISILPIMALSLKR
jgi:Putative homoserine kinase type II (protein kinase fold)